jgi:hypothetical protein
MRLSIYDLFTVGVAPRHGGCSKGRPIAYIEESDRCVPVLDLLIPNDLDDAGLARFVADKFATFARPGKCIAVLDDAQDQRVRRYIGSLGRRGVASPAFAGVQH